MMEKNNIDELFRSKLHDYSLEAPDHVWKNIEAHRTPLHRAINYFKNKRGAAAGALALLIGLSAVAYFGLSETQTTTQQERVVANTTVNAPQSSATTINAPAGEAVQTTVAQTPAATTAAGNEATTGGNNNNIVAGGNPRPDNPQAAPSNNPPASIITPPANNNGGDNNTTPVTNNNNTTTDGETLLTDNNIPVTPAPQDNKQEAPIAEAGPVLADNNAADGIEKTDEATGTKKLAVEPEKHRCNSLTADVYSSVDFAGRSLSANGVDANYFNAKKQSESFRPGFTVGARINLDLDKAKMMKLRVGIQYSRLGQSLNYNGEQKYTRMDTLYANVIDPNTGLPTGQTYPAQINEVTETRNISVASNNTYTFIDVPVQLELGIFKNKQFSMFATGGAAINLRFTQRGMELNRDLSGANEIRSTNAYKPTTGFSLLGGIGGEYKFSETSKYSLLVEGVYRHGLGNVYGSGSGMNQSFRSLSGTVGLRYRF